jgi:hypothetical protein
MCKPAIKIILFWVKIANHNILLFFNNQPKLFWGVLFCYLGVISQKKILGCKSGCNLESITQKGANFRKEMVSSSVIP